MEFSSLRFADVIVVAPVGRIDHASAEAFQTTLEPILVAAAGMNGALLLDLSNVPYISSVGLRVVMMAAKHLKARKARIAAVGLQSIVAEIFAISRFDSVFEMYPTLPAALDAMSRDARVAYDAASSPGV